MPQLSLHTPIDDLTLSEADGGIVAVDWGWGRDQEPTPLLVRARAAVQAYFDGILDEFDIPLAPHGSLYQRAVWAAIAAIPYGATRTYGEIARNVGGSPRAVGTACGANPIPLIVPCHRVTAASGLGGYSGGAGLDTKRWLLAFEARRCSSTLI